MGAENSKISFWQDKIRNEEQKQKEKIEDLDRMYKDPRSTCRQRLQVYDELDKMEKNLKIFHQMNINENKFNKDINLNDYRNDDGTFTVYKVERPLDFKFGKEANKAKEKLHHEGLAFGNKKNKFYTDYGVQDENVNVRFWDSKEDKENWEKIKEVGKSNASDNDIKEILFRNNIEKWYDPDGYSLIFHNCQDYSKEKIKELTKPKTETSK